MPFVLFRVQVTLTNKIRRITMNKILFRYLIYFIVFVFLVQLIENNQFQTWLASIGFRISLEPIGTYAPLFLSALLIDITYQIGKRQNKIAEQQNKIERHRMYKDIYSLVVQVDRETSHLVQDLYQIFIHIIQKQTKQRIAQMQGDYNACIGKIKACEIDFHILKLSNKDKVYDKIEEVTQLALTIMNILSMFNDLYLGKIEELKYPQKDDIIKIDDPSIDIFTRNFVAKIIELNQMSPMHLVDVIDSFIKKRHELFGSEHNILALIKEESSNDFNYCS